MRPLTWCQLAPSCFTGAGNWRQNAHVVGGHEAQVFGHMPLHESKPPCPKPLKKGNFLSECKLHRTL